MDKWLKAATDYIPQWLDYQMRQSELPGCSVALAHKGDIVLEAAFGSADLRQRTTLTPRHRFRVASHSKSFTAAGIMALREAGMLRLDLNDTCGHGFSPSLTAKVSCTKLFAARTQPGPPSPCCRSRT